jgi:hypothetical protein
MRGHFAADVLIEKAHLGERQILAWSYGWVWSQTNRGPIVTKDSPLNDGLVMFLLSR